MATLVPTLIVRVKQRLNLTPARQRLLLDAAIIVSLFLLALALRLPYLHDVPRYTDEVNEVRVGLSIARGEALRLTNADTYMGALYNYLLAGLFLLFGEHPHIPRLLIAFSGAATVPLVYILGKAINGRATGFMAALLLTGNAEHIFNSGHVAYSHSLTPAFTSLALFFLWRALNGGSYWMLLVGAFTFGLAVQTHPTAVVFAPGIVCAFFLQGRRWRIGRWPFLAIGAAALGYANVIAYNIITSGRGFAAGLAQRESYAAGLPLGLDVYPDHFIRGLETFRGMFDPSVWSDPPIVQWVRFPLFLLALLLLVLGLEILLIRRQYLIPLTLAGCILLLPFLAAYRVQLSRYWMLALPPLTLAIATGVVAAVQWTKGRVRLLSACLACSLILMLSTYSLPGLWQMYEARAQVRPTNAEMERLAGLVQETMRPGETVLIDIKIFEKRTADETGEPWTLGHLLTFRRVPVMYAVHESGQLGAILEQDPDRSYLLVAPLFSSATLPTDIATLAPGKIRAAPDPRSPVNELGLDVRLIHLKSER